MPVALILIIDRISLFLALAIVHNKNELPSAKANASAKVAEGPSRKNTPTAAERNKRKCSFFC